MTDFEFVIYCDGASRKDGRGGWGWTMSTDWGECFEQCGGDYNTTNNRMELMGAINALEECDACAGPKERLRIQVWSDSQYVVKGISEHIEDWRFRLWRTSANQPIKNRDLWERLYILHHRHEIDWQWVKGHTGNVGNERADVLAGHGIPPVSSERQKTVDPRGDSVSVGGWAAKRTSSHASCQTRTRR